MSKLCFLIVVCAGQSQLRGIDGRFRTSLAGQVTATRSWSEPADSAFVRAPIRPAPRQYSTNLDMLFAAVDEVSGASGGDDKAERASSAELGAHLHPPCSRTIEWCLAILQRATICNGAMKICMFLRAARLICR